MVKVSNREIVAVANGFEEMTDVREAQTLAAETDFLDHLKAANLQHHIEVTFRGWSDAYGLVGYGGMPKVLIINPLKVENSQIVLAATNGVVNLLAG